MYPIPSGETLVENRTCTMCTTIFPITDKDMTFYEKISPSFGGKKYLIPPPTLCPDCRQQRRLSFHNERKLYRWSCDATGENMISAYSPNSPYTVYSTEYYWSDSWDPMSYGRDFDFSKGFFEQFQEIFQAIPKQALVVKECENSEYLNFAYRVKNCYLIFASGRDENCYFWNRVNESKNCVDCLLIKQSENCYECISTFDSYDCQYCQRIKNCRESRFLEDCTGCSNCFMCVNLQNQEYHIKNIAYSESEYWSELEKYARKSRKELESEYQWFLINHPRKSTNFINTTDSFGDNIQNAKNVKYVFDGDILENVSYSYFVDDVTDCMDINYGYGNTILQYDSLWTGSNAYAGIFSLNVWPDISHLSYCETCTGCNDCFGCTWLRNKSYCILNKQYTREEYEELVPRIIEKMISLGEWWEFFPSSLSPFGYNETVASEYYPLIREEVVGSSPLRKGDVTEWQGDLVSGREQSKIPPTPFIKGERFNWSDYEAPFPKVEKVIPASKLPDTIEGIPDDILNWAIECEVSWKPFRIIKQELEFYRKHSLPIPRRHPDVRHMDRMKMRNPRKLFERKCDKCGKDMITTYSPERSERVYCQSCFDREVMS